MKPKELLHRILHYLNLEGEVDDYEKIHDTIQRDVVFKGTNLWILMFAIIVASIGLNMNSPAVIIGAMLISPLMGPINGMGYSIATYNFRLFRFSAKNFTFAVFASLVASTIYFTISPISTEHSELLARTSPTIYDVLIALFGGLAGIVAITSKHKGNVIPGVAIATALMPPLCTAGYGLAIGKYNFFLGALYLFTINTVFIALSSVLISKLLRFPITTIIDEKQKRKVTNWISAIIFIVIIPSIFFGYQLVKNENFKTNALDYVNSISFFEGNYLLKYDINPDKRTITLIYGGSMLSNEQKEKIIRRAGDFYIKEVLVDIKQGFSLETYGVRPGELERLRIEIGALKMALIEKERQVDSLTNPIVLSKKLLSELSAIFPQITNSTLSETFTSQENAGSPNKINLLVLETSREKLSKKEKETIDTWVRKRLGTDAVRIIYDN